MKKILKLFSYFTVFFYTFLPSFTHALEVNYPLIPGAPYPNSGSLTEYIQYIFIFAFVVAGFVGVISIVIAGFQKLLYSGSPGKAESANERIRNAVLGIIILMLAFILLRTINPALINPTELYIPHQAGVYFIEPNYVFECRTATNPDGGCIDDAHPDGYVWTSADLSVPDTSELYASTKLLYYCPDNPSLHTPILLWKYNEKNYEVYRPANGSVNIETVPISCSDSVFDAVNITRPIMSFSWADQEPGVYYYMTPDCSGIATSFGQGSPGQTESGNIESFDDTFEDQTVRSMRIINDPNQQFAYGVILTQDIDAGGECSEPIFASVNTNNFNDPNSCITIGSSAASLTKDDPPQPFDPYFAYIIKRDKNPNSNPQNVAVSFISNNKTFTVYQYPDIGFGWTYNSSSYPQEVDFVDESGDIVGSLPNDGNLDNAIRFLGGPANNYSSPIPIDECEEYRPEDPQMPHDSTYQDPTDNPRGRGYFSCLNKVQWDGNYNVILYTTNEQANYRGCQVLTQSHLFFDPKQEISSIDKSNIFNQYQVIYKTIIVPIY